MIRYFDEPDLLEAFSLVQKYYAEKEDVPDYRHESGGMMKLSGILSGVQQDSFYPSLLEKATYLLLQINKGHFFSNGNKRLALAVASVFLLTNGGRFNEELTQDDYRKIFGELFPTYVIDGAFPDFSPTDFALYNLSILIADSTPLGIGFEELKTNTRLFLERMIVGI